MGQDIDPTTEEENALFRTGRREPKVVSLLEARKQRRKHADFMLGGRIQLARTESDSPAKVEGVRFDPLAVLAELEQSEVFVLLQPAEPGQPPSAKVVSRRSAKYILAFERRDMISALAGENAQGSPILLSKLLHLMPGNNVGLAINLGDPEASALVSPQAIEEFLNASNSVDAQEDLPELAQDDPAPKEESTTAPETEKNVPEEIEVDNIFDQSTLSGGQDNAPNTPVVEVGFRALLAPKNFPSTLAKQLKSAYSQNSDLAKSASLIRAEYQDGTSGFLVVHSGVEPANYVAIERLISKSMAAHDETLALDISFLEADDPMLKRILKIGETLKI